MPEIRQLNASDKDFWQQLDAVLAWEQSADSGVAAIVTDILADVKKRGDAAVLEYTKNWIVSMSARPISWNSVRRPYKKHSTPLIQNTAMRWK